MLAEQGLDLLSNARPAILELSVIEILERQIDDRLPLEVGAVRVAGLPDGQVLEEGGPV